MTASATSSLRSALGAQVPRIEWVPPGKPHPDQEAALEVARLVSESAGTPIQEWQERVFGNSLLEKRHGKWASFENALCVPRQNGKSELVIWRMLAGALVLGERLIVYTAHLAKTSEEVFRRTREIIDSADWLADEVKHTWRSNGRESIEFKNGARILFQTRTPSSGRGFAKADCVVLDEAMYLPGTMVASILFILGRARNPQLWYLGSAPDQITMPDSVAFAAVRERGMEGGDESLMYAEWSIPDYTTPMDVPVEVLTDPEVLASANPALGYGLPLEQVMNEWRTSQHDPRAFAIERGGIGDWPATGGTASIISLDEWAKLADPASKPEDPVRFAFDATPDRAFATIGVAGARQDGLRHLEVVQRERGLGWLVPRIVELHGKHPSAAFVTDASGPAGSLIPELERAGVQVCPVSAPEYAQACGMLYDGVAEGTIRHLADPRLTSAIAGATQRNLGDRWVLSRRNSSVDISPLVACTLALWGHLTTETAEPWIGAW